MRSCLFILIIALTVCGQVRGEGTKQLLPDSNYYCALRVQNGGGGYSCFATAFCSPDEKLYVRITHPGEKIFMGFKNYDGTVITITVKLNGNMVFYSGSINQTNGTPGYIMYHSQATFGPDVLGPAGYPAVSYAPAVAGDYDIELPPGSNLNLFDITVIDTTITPWHPTEGRLWSKSWAFNTGSLSGGGAGLFYGKQYILTEDSIVTSLDYNGMQGHLFDAACNRNGCFPPPEKWDTSCRSRPGGHRYPQYMIFVNDPDSLEFPTGIFGSIVPGTFQATATCDGEIEISFAVNKEGNAKVYLEINQVPGLQTEDVLIMDTVSPGMNTFIWNGQNGLGLPVPAGDTVGICMEYINGLTNYPVFDVEQNYWGFIIELVRPGGPPIATFWNDTLLAAKGGRVQLEGCYASLPNNGCHNWAGYYNGVGLGSLNTVNTWWYAASSKTNEIQVEVKRFPDAAGAINGPATVCQAEIATYTAGPLPGADTTGYEWVLLQESTGIVLFDSVGLGDSITIPFGSFSPGNLRLKVRGHNATCGYGPFGPGVNGEGMLIILKPSPAVTNPVTTYGLCSGGTTDILLGSSTPATTWEYSASATASTVTGYSGGSLNPIQQTLVNTAAETDTVIYRVVPFADGCFGDTAVFFVKVSPQPQVINTQFRFSQCSGDTTAITLQGNYAGVNFNWTATSASPVITGYADSSGTVIAQVLNNPGPMVDSVIYTVTPDFGGCLGPPVDFWVTVIPGQTVSVTVSHFPDAVCAGESMTFTAAAINGGATPLYQWFVNGVNLFTGSPVFTYTPNDGDIVIVHGQSSIVNCTFNNPATSIPVAVMVNPNVTVGVTVTPSSNPFCQGEPVTFTAAAINGGVTPFFQWFVNGVNLFTGSPVYTYTPTDGDIVIVHCQSSIVNCITNNPATSPPVTMVVNSSLPAGVTIAASDNPFCPGTMVTFTATPLNSGTAPTFQWLVNGANQFTGSPVYQFAPQAGDSIRCIMTSNLSCVTGNPASSTNIIMIGSLAPSVAFSACFDTVTNLNAKPFKLKGGLPLGGTYSGPGVNSSTGIFTPSIAGPGNHQISYTYTNAHGCSAAKQSLIHSFTQSLIACGQSITDIRDGKTYPTVQIGSQCWFQKNLEYGITIPENTPQTDNCIPEKYTRHASPVTRHDLYQWNELMQYQTTEGSQGLCPPGWHVPTSAEWDQLLAFLNGPGQAGWPMIDTLTVYGFRSFQQGFYYLNNTWAFESGSTAGSMYWTSTPSGSHRAVARGLNQQNPSVSSYPSSRGNAFAVRCVRDN